MGPGRDFGGWWDIWVWAPVSEPERYLSFVFALNQRDVRRIIQGAAFRELFAGGAMLCAVEYPFAAYGALTDHDSAPLAGGMDFGLK